MFAAVPRFFALNPFGEGPGSQTCKRRRRPFGQNNLNLGKCFVWASYEMCRTAVPLICASVREKGALRCGPSSGDGGLGPADQLQAGQAQHIEEVEAMLRKSRDRLREAELQIEALQDQAGPHRSKGRRPY